MNGRPALNIIESIRKRPNMYLGTTNSYGIRRLLKIVIEEYLQEVTGIATIEVTFNPDNHISIIISGVSVDELLHEIVLLHQITTGKNFKIGMLIGISRALLVRIITGSDIHMLSSQSGEYETSTATSAEEPNGIKLDFQLDESIFKDCHVSYIPMNIMFQQMAYLNAGLKIISVDNRGELQRNVFYFKTGIKELFIDLLDKHDYGRVNAWFFLELKTAINGYIYHILLRYHHIYTTYPEPYIKAFANNESTKSGGSVVDGVIKGLEDAFLEIGEMEGADLKVNKKRVSRQLVLIASIKGPSLEYGGKTKDKLEMPGVKKDLRKYVKKAVLKHLEAHPADKKRVLEKFKKD